MKKTAGKKGLTAKQKAFVQEYLIDLNATQAAIRAGYSEKTAYSLGQRLLKNERVKAAIQEAMEKRERRVEVDQDYILNNLKTIAERCMQAIPVTDRSGQMVFVENTDGILCPAYTFNAQGALKGNELIGKHLGMFVNKHEITGKDGGPIEVTSSVIERIWQENEELKADDE